MSEKIKDANFGTGAVRSADVDDYDFASAPLAGLLGVMKIAGNGGIKYGRHNYSKGIPVHVTLNHVAVHLIKYLLGDRSEDHLSKVAWGAMVANQTATLQPELADPYLLGPGATVTEPMIAEMDKDKEEREAKRKAGEFEKLFAWTLADLPEVKALMAKRNPKRAWAQLIKAELAKHVALEERKKTEELKGRRQAHRLTPRTDSHVPVKPDDQDLAPHAAGPVSGKPTGDIHPSFGPGSTNEKVYGRPTRTEWAGGIPTPRPGERWTEYDDGTRAYFLKDVKPREESQDPALHAADLAGLVVKERAEAAQRVREFNEKLGKEAKEYKLDTMRS